MHWVYCPHCGNELGQVFGERIAMKHRGREWIGPVPDVVRCEECRQNVEGDSLTMVRPDRQPVEHPRVRQRPERALLGGRPDPLRPIPLRLAAAI